MVGVRQRVPLSLVPPQKTQGAKSQTGIPGQKHYTHAAALSLGEKHSLCDPPHGKPAQGFLQTPPVFLPHDPAVQPY